MDELDRLNKFLIDIINQGVDTTNGLSLEQEVEYRQLCGEYDLYAGNDGLKNLHLSIEYMIRLIMKKHCE